MQFRDLKKQYQALKPQIDEAVTKVMTDANFISGSQVAALEKRLADYVGVKHCITCANGTDALKLAEIELVKKLTGEPPVLLLDDVLSELDSNRQNYLLNSINNVQTIITCTGLDDFINNRFSINSIFKVVNGRVFKEN